MLVRRGRGRLLAVARRILRSHDAAEDAVQDAFLSAFRNLDRFEGNARLSTWLHRIAVNAALTRLRAKKSRPEESIERLLRGSPADEGLPRPVVASGGEAEDELASRERLAIVCGAIDELPQTYRIVLVLRDVEGLDIAETAAALGVSYDAAKMRLHRARRALRTLLDERLPREDR